MDKEQVRQIARDCGFTFTEVYDRTPELQRFAAKLHVEARRAREGRSPGGLLALPAGMTFGEIDVRLQRVKKELQRRIALAERNVKRARARGDKHAARGHASTLRVLQAMERVWWSEVEIPF